MSSFRVRFLARPLVVQIRVNPYITIGGLSCNGGARATRIWKAMVSASFFDASVVGHFFLSGGVGAGAHPSFCVPTSVPYALLRIRYLH